MFYLVNFILVLIYYLLLNNAIHDKQVVNRRFALLVGIHAILFRALADPFNYVDTEGYSLAFDNIRLMSFKEAITSQYQLWGQGYVAFNWLIGQFFKDSTFFFVIVSVISVGATIWFYKKSSHDIFWPVVLYLSYPMLYYMGFGVIRQHLSIGILLMALYFMDKPKLSAPLSILALLFHSSAIVIFPFYLFNRLEFKKFSLLKTLIVVIGGFVALRLAMDTVLSYFERYSEQGFGEEGNNNIVPVILLGIPVILFYLSKANIQIKDTFDNTLFNFIVYGFLVSIFSIGLEGAGRLSLCFIYVAPLSIPILRKYSLKGGLYANLYISIFVLLTALQLYMSYNPLKYIYKSIL